jgi:FkbM family methyltransferase
MHTIHNDRWNNDRGNDTLITNYLLTEDSWVLELGGFEGWWTDKMIQQHRCNIIVLEPVPQFFNQLQQRFESVSKVYLENKAITGDGRKVTLNISGDGTSETLLSSDQQITVDSVTVEDLIDKYKIDRIGLIQMNIEGEEYQILPALISNKTLAKVDNIHIQFHRTNTNYEQQRVNIQESLKALGFELQWCYDYVWESWKNINR